MSRNRSKLTCDCGLDFVMYSGLRRKPESRLIDLKTYLTQIGRLSLVDSMNGWEKPTLFANIICPQCLMEFAGWYGRPEIPPESMGSDWELYDTSYWSNFSDMPVKGGLKGVRFHSGSIPNNDQICAAWVEDGKLHIQMDANAVFDVVFRGPSRPRAILFQTSPFTKQKKS